MKGPKHRRLQRGCAPWARRLSREHNSRLTDTTFSLEQMQRTHKAVALLPIPSKRHADGSFATCFCGSSSQDEMSSRQRRHCSKAVDWLHLLQTSHRLTIKRVGFCPGSVVLVKPQLLPQQHPARLRGELAAIAGSRHRRPCTRALVQAEGYCCSATIRCCDTPGPGDSEYE